MHALTQADQMLGIREALATVLQFWWHQALCCHSADLFVSLHMRVVEGNARDDAPDDLLVTASCVLLARRLSIGRTYR